MKADLSCRSCGVSLPWVNASVFIQNVDMLYAGGVILMIYRWCFHYTNKPKCRLCP